MSKDDNGGSSRSAPSEDLRHRWKRAAARGLGTLLKVGGVLAVLAGLLMIALSNMDGAPFPDLVWGTVTTCVGLPDAV